MREVHTLIRRFLFESEWRIEVTQLCPTLCDPMDCSLPGSSVHGIFQAIVLEWIAISFSRGSSQPRDRTQVSHIVDRCFTVWATMAVTLKGKWKCKSLSHVWLFAILWTMYSPWNSPGQNTGLSLLQEIFPAQGWNTGLLPYRQILYHLSHRGSHKGRNFFLVIFILILSSKYISPNFLSSFLNLS